MTHDAYDAEIPALCEEMPSISSGAELPLDSGEELSIDDPFDENIGPNPLWDDGIESGSTVEVTS